MPIDENPIVVYLNPIHYGSIMHDVKTLSILFFRILCLFQFLDRFGFIFRINDLLINQRGKALALCIDDQVASARAEPAPSLF